MKGPTPRRRVTYVQRRRGVGPFIVTYVQRRRGVGPFVIDERPHPTPPLDVRHAGPGFAVLFPISRRWSAPTTNSRPSFALVSADRPSAARLPFSCRGTVGALLRTSGAGGEHVLQR